ncbi:MAG: leucine-rich repeat domain-containing protein [Pirellulaceae bacterium]|nr:leucine-rich repeat domain-containing protein [Pirellulaceae bacterium]
MEAPPRKQRFRFTLKSLLIAITLICVGPATFLSYEQQQAMRIERAVDKLRQIPGCEVLCHAPSPLRIILTPCFGGFIGELKGINLTSGLTQDSDLAPLAELPELERLFINDTKVTDLGLIHLAGLRNLRHLELDGTQITDAGLPILAKLKSLKRIDLRNTQITKAGVNELQTALPDLEITR